jgi:hypothetical protein
MAGAPVWIRRHLLGRRASSPASAAKHGICAGILSDRLHGTRARAAQAGKLCARAHGACHYSLTKTLDDHSWFVGKLS